MDAGVPRLVVEIDAIGPHVRREGRDGVRIERGPVEVRQRRPQGSADLRLGVSAMQLGDGVAQADLAGISDGPVRGSTPTPVRA